MTILESEVYKVIDKHFKNSISYLPDYDSFINKVRHKFCKGPDKNIIWECLTYCCSIKDERGWEKIKGFVGDQMCFLFTDAVKGYILISIDSGMTLSEFLSETTAFVFYITNKDIDYLLCFNDHDYIIGCGKAAEWIEQLKTTI